jgi:hypothetical protein
MTLDGSGTPPTTPEVQPEAAVTPEPVDEVTKLKSRNAGLDAKVSELLRAQAAEKARADAAEARAMELAAGKDNGDQELRAQLQAKEAELTETRKLAALNRIEAKYPETFGVLGAAAAGLTEDQLAASEARFAGVTETSAPRTLGSNPQRPVSAGPKALEDMTVAELEKHIKGFDPSVLGRQP